MVTSLQTNLAMIELVARRLGRLREEVVFLGGAATALLITDTAAPDVRATMDVDVIVEVTSTFEYYRLAEALRTLGFAEDTGEDAPICRWRIDGIAVDIMPTDEEILGFSNRWYLPALRLAEIREVAGGIPIRVATAPYFLATKIEAFHGRGHGDFMASHDVEDIIAVIDGRAEIVEEVLHAPEMHGGLLQRVFANSSRAGISSKRCRGIFRLTRRANREWRSLWTESAPSPRSDEKLEVSLESEKWVWLLRGRRRRGACQSYVQNIGWGLADKKACYNPSGG